jgi:hypothetical protein
MNNFLYNFKCAKGFGVFMFAVLFVACSQLDIEPNQPGDNLRVLALEAINGGPIGELLAECRYTPDNFGGNVSCENIYVECPEEGEVGVPIGFENSTGRIVAEDPEFYNKFEEKGFKITITDSKYVSWEYIGTLCLSEVAVIVKGGNAPANVYYYSGEGIIGDSGLVSPDNEGNQIPDLSNLTICFTEVPCDDQCFEFDGDTAWGANGDVPGELRYNQRGNWATYIKYSGAKTVTLFAGQTKVAGTVSFSAAVGGEVEITINLADGWAFEENEKNVKIQDYAGAPSGNPAPGIFDHYGEGSGSSFSIKVPANKFYGVHVDVGQWVEIECEVEE